jgi:predicted transcriptional regulator
MSSVDLAERAYRRLTTQEARQVADAARKKERPRVTALRLGVPLPSVLRIFREVGEPIRPTATPAQKSLALEMARQGVKYPEIAKQIGVSRAAVQSWAAAAGIVRRGLPSALTTEEIAQKIRENLTQAEIKRMGATHSQIQKAIEEYGLQKRARRNKD